MRLPTSYNEIKVLEWDGLDIILITGEGYSASPLVDVAVIGKILFNAMRGFLSYRKEFSFY